MKKIISLSISLVLICSVIFTMSARTENTVYSATENVQWEYSLEHDNTAKIVGCSTDERIINIPDQIDGHIVTSIGSTAFYNSDIEKITLPSSIKTIGWWAFYGCENLYEVNLNSGLNTIEYGAFMNCNNLFQVEIPSTVSKIGEDAFAVVCYCQVNINDIYSKKKVSRQNYVIDSNFVISGYSGTISEKYAKNNNLCFNDKATLLFGDADINGQVDDNDIILIEKYINKKTKLSEIQLLNSDVNGDAVVNDADLVFIKNYAKNLISYYGYPVTENLAESPMYIEGMSMYCDGDSVAKGTGTNIFGNDFYSYCNYLTDEYDINCVNNAVAGTTIAKQKGKTKDSNKSILERVQNMNGEYDIILLDGGFNDLFQSIEIGEITPYSDRSGNYNDYTTIGALESICYFLNENYKDSIKLFVLCHKRNENSDQDKYWNEIIQVLDKWDISYVDFRTETDFCDVNDEITTQYFMYNSEKNKGDGIHPSKHSAQKIYGPEIANKLNTLAKDRITAEFENPDIEVGIAEKVIQTFKLNGYSNAESVRWVSEDTSVAVIDENGTVTPRCVGTTDIRACTSDGITAEYRLTVKLMAMEINFNCKELTLNVGESYKLKTNMFFNTAAYYKSYSTSDSSIVTVSSDGVVTANGKGTAIITCKTINGVKTECVVKVSEENTIMLSA